MTRTADHNRNIDNRNSMQRPLDEAEQRQDDKLWRDPSIVAPRRRRHRGVVSAEQVLSVRQCRPLGATFAAAVAQWLQENDAHEDDALSKDGEHHDSSSKPRAASRKAPIKRLIYSCEAHRAGKLCGGMGDRFRGMVSSAFLALLSRRRYELFHPVPVPLQSLLSPRFIPWVPTIRRKSTDGIRSSSPAASLQRPASFSELDAHMQSMPLNRNLMNLKQSKFVVPLLHPSHAELDLRIQSNTVGIDKYILRDPVLKQRFTEELGLPVSCNLTCYYGCMYALLFEPSDELHRRMRQTLPKEFTVRSAASSSSSSPFSYEEEQNIADAVVEVHRGQRTQLLPMVGMQVRVGGSWAGEFVVPEPFRTVPAAFPLIFRDLQYCQCPSSFANDKNNNNNGEKICSAKGEKWPVFVTSDSERFVNLTRKEQQLVYYNPGNSYRHTDTDNAHEFSPRKWAKLALKSADNRRAVYTNTLINHVVLAACDSLVFGQSGFADSAFWAARPTREVKAQGDQAQHQHTVRPAGVGFFVDMTNNRLAWEHTLSYEDEPGKPSAAVARKNRVVDFSSGKVPPFF